MIRIKSELISLNNIIEGNKIKTKQNIDNLPADDSVEFLHVQANQNH